MALIRQQLIAMAAPLTIKLKSSKKKKLLLLDMDETLLHAASLVDIYQNQIYGKNTVPTFITSFIDQGKLIEFGVFVRPFFKEMLARLVSLFEICVYTASEKSYADAILDQLDPKRLYFKQRLYREQCTFIKVDNKQVYVKDLRCIKDYDLSSIVIVDNSLLSFSLHVDNGIPISNFFNDP